MDKIDYQTLLSKYIPEKSISGIINLLDKHPVHLKITRERLTKQGDFRLLRNGQPQITVNHNLNPYQFLLTLVHEIAHYTTYKRHKRVKPHGKEWKDEFRQLMLQFLTNEIYPNGTLPYLAQYFINPKAATGSDVQLSRVLRKFDAPSENPALYELELGSQFILHNKSFILGNKKRTRYECIEEKTSRKYLIHGNAIVKKIT